MELSLNYIGTNQTALQKEYLKWLLSKSTCYLKQELSIKDISSMMAIVEKCLQFVGNISFSPVWIVLLDKVQMFGNRNETLQLYHKIDQEVLRLIMTGDPAPLSVLLHLWQTHLPSLEFVVIKVLEHMTMGSSSSWPCALSPKEILQKSFLVQASRHEPVICYALQSMLKSLSKQTQFTSVAAHILKLLSQDI
ncbi:hypothetical protein ElyMa_004583800 [Elysia marginata]|uniref:Uncharacterized protein n=1 Tax=Elysia marginata TaxID=1093978 RepID=A0AAV4HVR8_9GAST|nr:hypothetical protein ElyMa_004583800 [Elysia marginata]